MSISRISLYHLETLLWIDRLGTFSAAAERLNTTQPAVSARMRELEQRLGTVLFRREGRAMSLTAAGRKLVRDCDPLLRDMQYALLGSGGYGEASGVVRIGAGEIAAALDVPPTNLSFHLKALTQAGMLTVEQEGRFQRYRANIPLMLDLIAYLTEECCAGNPAQCADLHGVSACTEAVLPPLSISSGTFEK